MAKVHSLDTGIEADCLLIELKCNFIDAVNACATKDEMVEPQYFIDRLDDILFVRMYLQCVLNKQQCAECHAHLPQGDNAITCECCKIVNYCSNQCRDEHWRAHSLDCRKLTTPLHPTHSNFIYALLDI